MGTLLGLSQTEALAELKALAKLAQADLLVEQVEKQAETLAVDVMTRIRSVIDALLLPDGPAVEIGLEHEGHIADAALAVSKARSDLEQAKIELEHAEADVATLDDRLKRLEAARNTIIARRMGGIVDRDDGTQIGLLDADIEGVRQLFTNAQEVVTAAQGAKGNAGAAVIRTTATMQRAEDAAKMAILLANADRLGGLMTANLAALEELRSRTGGRPVWNPGRILYLQVRRAAAASNLL
jgi:hypothetical protein